MRKKRLLWNTISSLGNQIITIVCGFVLPRIILLVYGSEVNGLVSSITQFLGIIAFLEFGVGAVIQSALYQPLAQRDIQQISKIVVSSNKFFRKIAVTMAVYVVVLCMCYPRLTSGYDFVPTVILIIAMSISSFAQYYFGITNQLLLTAAQKGYIVYLLQGVTVVANTIICTAMIWMGVSIQMVKLTTSIIFLLRPIGQYIYVCRNYNIDKHVVYSKEPLEQKWNGLAQHISAVILENTDTIVLTCLSSLENVSVYSVYYLIVHGVKQIFLSLTRGVQALLGELWAKNEYEELQKTFAWTEWSIHTGVVFFFGCTMVLIVPFVEVYTYGIVDVNYCVPIFAVFLTIAHACHCLRLPYNIMVLVAGHYKQTQKIYIIPAILNVMISVITVKQWGIVGVAIGTLVAMVIQSIWLAMYVSEKLLNKILMKSCRQLIVDYITVGVCWFVSRRIPLLDISYGSWCILAIEVASLWLVIIVVINKLFYPEKVRILLNKVKAKIC